MKVRTNQRVAGAIIGAALGVAPQLVGAREVSIVSPGLLLAAHGGAGDGRLGIGLETTYMSFDSNRQDGWSAGYIQLELFGDGSIRLGIGHQWTMPGAGLETGPSLHFGPDGDIDLGFQFAPWVGIGIVNIAGRIIPRFDGLEYGGALTLKAPFDLDRQELYDPFEGVVVDGRPVRDADGAAIRPGVVAIGRRPVPDEARRLPDPVRVALGRAWLDAARDEHGSIAAFHRLALQLRAHGAPGALIADARRAAADEDRHARTCFAIAGALLGLRLRPIAATVPAGAVPDRAEMAVESVIDGEFNEGAAARLAALGADAARIGPVRDALSTIAAEEEQHAALARDVHSWAVSAPDVDERRRVRARVDAARQVATRTIAPRHHAPRGHEQAWADWGRPTAAHARAVNEAIQVS